jgi:hypothetical protein
MSEVGYQKHGLTSAFRPLSSDIKNPSADYRRKGLYENYGIMVSI